jgi:hypothetical protein
LISTDIPLFEPAENTTVVVVVVVMVVMVVVGALITAPATPLLHTADD